MHYTLVHELKSFCINNLVCPVIQLKVEFGLNLKRWGRSTRSSGPLLPIPSRSPFVIHQQCRL